MSAVRENIDPYTQSFFSLKNRLARFVWGIVWTFFFRPSPRPLHAWRALLLRAFGAKLGHGCHVYPSAKIWAPWNLVMDDRASLGDDVICYSMDIITLGKGAIVSQGSHLCAGTHDYETPDFQLFTKPITIGEEAWLCAESFVMPGVTIGDRAVIGVRSVVTKDMPADMVCFGAPCRPHKPRNMRGERAGDTVEPSIVHIEEGSGIQ